MRTETEIRDTIKKVKADMTSPENGERYLLLGTFIAALEWVLNNEKDSSGK